MGAVYDPRGKYFCADASRAGTNVPVVAGISGMVRKGRNDRVPGLRLSKKNMLPEDKDSVELPYLVFTKYGYMVTGPDKHGDVEIEQEGYPRCLYLSASDLRMMLARIEKDNVRKTQ